MKNIYVKATRSKEPKLYRNDQEKKINLYQEINEGIASGDIISGGGGDNLGNHIATQKLDLATNKLVGEGGTEGIYVDATGALFFTNKTNLVQSANNEGIDISSSLWPGSYLRLNIDQFGRASFLGSSSINLASSGGLDLTSGGFMRIRSNATIRLADNNAIDVTLVEGGGNIGIGTPTPGAKLDVLGTGTGSSFLMNCVNTATNQFLPELSMLAPNMDIGNSAYMTIGKSSSTANRANWGFVYKGNNDLTNYQSFSFFGVASPVMNLLANGNVGIGTTAPATKLDIVGQATLLGNGFYGGFYFSGAASFANYDTANKIVMSSPSSVDGLYSGGLHMTRRNFAQQGEYGAGIRGISEGTTLQDNALELYTSTSASRNSTKLRINAVGNIGIGDITPITKLDVDGAITQRELSVDPADPVEGSSVTWQSDGTGSGDDGDIMMKITAGGVTKITTLIDFSII